MTINLPFEGETVMLWIFLYQGNSSSQILDYDIITKIAIDFDNVTSDLLSSDQVKILNTIETESGYNKKIIIWKLSINPHHVNYIKNDFCDFSKIQHKVMRVECNLNDTNISENVYLRVVAVNRTSIKYIKST